MSFQPTEENSISNARFGPCFCTFKHLLLGLGKNNHQSKGAKKILKISEKSEGEFVEKHGGAERKSLISKPIFLGDRRFFCKKLNVFKNINNSIMQYVYIT